MNKMIKNFVAFSLVALPTAALADGWVLFDREEGTWRISGGAVLDFGVKTRLTSNQRETYASPYVQGDTAVQAEAKANGVSVSPTKKVYPNGAWIDTDDPGLMGDMPGYTGYYYFPGAPGENNLGSSFSLGTAHFSEVSTFGERAGSVSHSESDKEVVPGFNVEVARTLYRVDDQGWGVDLAFAFQYFCRNKVFKDYSSWRSGSSVYEGSYSSSIDTGDVYAADPLEDSNWLRDANGSYYGYGSGEPTADGTGGYAGPIDGGSVAVAYAHNYRSDSAWGSMSSRADYENLELMFMVRPWYNVTDWLRVVGNLGVVVSRQELEFTATMMRNGLARGYSRDFDEWSVYGVGGLGAVVHYEGFTLGLDAFVRFLDDEMAVHDTYVHGDVERGTWVGRLSIGYEF